MRTGNDRGLANYSPDHPPMPDTESVLDHTRAVARWLDDLLDRWDGTVPDATRTRAVKLSDIVPERKWWLLYLDPRHHAQALQMDPVNPGGRYDGEASPGFQRGMVAAFKSVLDDPARVTGRVGWPEYLRMYALATSHVRARAEDNTYFEVAGVNEFRDFYLGADRRPPTCSATSCWAAAGEHDRARVRGRRGTRPRVPQRRVVRFDLGVPPFL